MSPDTPDAGRTFAAQTFRAKVDPRFLTAASFSPFRPSSRGPNRDLKKVTHDLHQLDGSQRAGLRDTLIAAIQKYANGPRPVLIELCLALSGLALQMKEWDNPLLDLINALGQNPTTVPTLLLFLTVLPGEVAGNTWVPISTEEFRAQEAQLLTANGPEVLKLLTMYSQAEGMTPAVQAQVLNCLRSWLQTGEVTSHMVAATPLFQVTFSGLAHDELFEPAIDVLCGLIHETQEFDDDMDVIQALIPQLVALRPVLSTALQAHDADKVRGYCRLFTEAGKTYRLLILQHPETFFPLVEAIGDCAAYHDLDIVPVTFPFRFRLAQSIGKKPDVPKPVLDAYRTLMGAIIKHLHFPANPENMSPHQRDKFKGFRHIVGDTLKDCCYVLGTDGCLLTTYEMITQALAKGSLGQLVSWQDIEAPLFSVHLMGAEVNPDDDKIVSQIMDLIPQLPAHPRIRYAAIMVISSYAEWTYRHPTYIPFQLTYLLAGFDDSDQEVAAASGQAMKYMCKDCQQHLVPYIPQLHTFVQSMGSKLLQADRLKVYEAIAYVIAPMPMEDAGQTLRLFSLDLISHIHGIVSKPAAEKEELTNVADALELLETMLVVIQSFGEELPAACKNTAMEVYADLDALIAKYGNAYFISEKVCRVIKQGMQFFGKAAAVLAPSLLRRVGGAYQSTGFSSFLWLQGKVVEYYGTSSDPALQLALKETLEQSSAQTYAVLKVQAPSDIPDGQSIPMYRVPGLFADSNSLAVIEDYLHLLIQMLTFCPDYVLLSPSFPSSFPSVLTALTRVHPDIISSALDLLRMILGHESMTPSAAQPAKYVQYATAIRQTVSVNGFQFVGLLLSGMVTTFPEDSVRLVASLFRLLAGGWRAELATWLPPAVQQLPAASLPMEARAKFLTDMANALSDGNLDHVRSSILSLNRASQRAKERSRDFVA
ncbi:Nuclear import receptor [Tulasnella sp. 417]|nr:Nuclear import receptor [Tulasnella sp. 417]